MLELKREIEQYTAKDGTRKDAVKYYVEVALGTTILKVQLKPVDYTGREILDSILVK